MSVYPLPEGFQMGNLEMVEVFEYYDGPQLFACRSQSGLLYLVVGVDSDELTETWLYVPVSKERLVYVRSGGMDLRTAFKTPEDGFLLVVTTDKSGNATLATTSPKDLDDAWLPVAGEFLSLSSETLPQLRKDDLQTKATQRWREHVAVKVEQPGSTRNEASAALTGGVLTETQATLLAIEEHLERARSPNNRLQRDWRPTAILNVVALAAGSFVLELAAESPGAELFGTSPVGDAVEQFLRLIRAGADEEGLSALLASLEARAAGKYRNLLFNLSKAGAGLSLQWASPTEDRGGEASLSATEVRAAYDLVVRMGIEQEPEKKIFGILRGFLPSSKTYEFFDPQERKRYKGRVNDSVLPVISGATLGSTYVATLQASVEVHPVLGEERTKWLLVLLEQADDQEPKSE